MCGFAGELRLDGRRPDRGAVAAMAATMSDRGPDGEGAHAVGPIAFGHRRLKVIDLSDAGAQPMTVGSQTMVFNGCIYNYPQLRDELTRLGRNFTSTSDTEVIIHGWQEWGEDLLPRLNGMFAFVIYDHDSGRTVLARDRLGIKPLYLAETPGRMRFASTLPALVAGGEVDTSIDLVALHHYLTFHAVVPAPRTILRGVRKLPPATVLTIDRDGTRRDRRWWEPRLVRDSARADWTVRDHEDAVLAALRRSVRRRLVADVPVGVLLSGGLDSSLIVGLLAEAGQHGLATFSVGFESVGGEQGDEFKYSDVIAREFGTDHHQIRVPAGDSLAALEPTIAAMSEPMTSHDCVGFYLLSREVAKHVKVVQSGQGADEVFAGYHWYQPLLGAAVPRSGAGAHTQAADQDAYATYREAFFDRDHADLIDLLAEQWRPAADHSGRFVLDHFARPGAQTAVDKALRLDTQVMLVDDPVKRVDNMTMAWGLEGRVPFLDHEVVEVAGKVPPRLHLSQDGKGVLKEVARRVIPADVIDRPKGYFPMPALKHLQGPFLELVRDALSSRAARERGLFRRERLDALFADPNADLTPLRGNRLWQLGLLELWLQTHLQG